MHPLVIESTEFLSPSLLPRLKRRLGTPSPSSLEASWPFGVLGRVVSRRGENHTSDNEINPLHLQDLHCWKLLWFGLFVHLTIFPPLVEPWRNSAQRERERGKSVRSPWAAHDRTTSSTAWSWWQNFSGARRAGDGRYGYGIYMVLFFEQTGVDAGGKKIAAFCLLFFESPCFGESRILVDRFSDSWLKSGSNKTTTVGRAVNARRQPFSSPCNREFRWCVLWFLPHFQRIAHSFSAQPILILLQVKGLFGVSAMYITPPTPPMIVLCSYDKKVDEMIAISYIFSWNVLLRHQNAKKPKSVVNAVYFTRKLVIAVVGAAMNSRVYVMSQGTTRMWQFGSG